MVSNVLSSDESNKSWEQILHYPVWEKWSFLTKLSSVYDWLELQVLIFTEIQSMKCKHSG